MCLGDWKTHGSEYYECSRYKENPNIAHESAHAQAREALKKYLHYFERVGTSDYLLTLRRILLYMIPLSVLTTARVHYLLFSFSGKITVEA